LAWMGQPPRRVLAAAFGGLARITTVEIAPHLAAGERLQIGRAAAPAAEHGAEQLAVACHGHDDLITDADGQWRRLGEQLRPALAQCETQYILLFAALLFAPTPVD
jgi:hypothetical protein